LRICANSDPLLYSPVGSQGRGSTHGGALFFECTQIGLAYGPRRQRIAKDTAKDPAKDSAAESAHPPTSYTGNGPGEKRRHWRFSTALRVEYDFSGRRSGVVRSQIFLRADAPAQRLGASDGAELEMRCSWAMERRRCSRAAAW